jgi:DNA-binding NarL/FixJ family response regulator
MTPIRVFVADDHNIIITGIQSMLAEATDIEIAGQAADGDEMIQLVDEAEQKPDLILMDIKMPAKNGVQTTEELLQRFPDLQIMALTMYDDEEYVTSMLQAGARGYVLKNTDKDELAEAIRTVAQGETYFGREATSAVMAKYMNNARGSEASAKGAALASEPAGARQRETTTTEVHLTSREMEILRLIASEHTNQEIADKLYISPRTVHSHRRNLMQKVGVKNTAGLVRYAMEHQIH